MAGKGKGWHDDSRRHSLARKGIKTNIDGSKRFDVSNYVARGRLDLKEFPPTNLVGDGKLPNLYWVTVSNYFYVYDPIELERIGVDEINKDLQEQLKVKDFKTKGETVAVFSSYKEAKDFVEGIWDSHDNIIIEDRLSGELFEKSLTKQMQWQDFVDSREDTDFTEKELAKNGVEFK